MIILVCSLCDEKSDPVTPNVLPDKWNQTGLARGYYQSASSINLCPKCSKRLDWPERRVAPTDEKLIELLRELITEEIGQSDYDKV